ncbi:hypothetical protein RI129_005486 [Pyrocoelia pectoralis]|uniref:Cytochrome P450 n=1 Tax=Pyrocoelia pectoralis TaxID=417401 RepID=A0AAN7VFQ4_9COLE
MPSLAKIFKWACVNRDSVTFFRKIFSATEMSRNQIDAGHFLAQMKRFETDEDIFKLYGDRLLAQALTFVVAGHTAISTIFAFTLHELAINVHMQERLREEIVGNMNHFGDTTFESLQCMPYMHMLLQETLRKYPFTPFIHRECSKDYVFSETGLKIDKGTGIIIPQHALFWDRNHFPNPEVYDPERFSIENKHKINHSVYVPFGDGPRNCVGRSVALG